MVLVFIPFGMRRLEVMINGETAEAISKGILFLLLSKFKTE